MLSVVCSVIYCLIFLPAQASDLLMGDVEQDAKIRPPKNQIKSKLPTNVLALPRLEAPVRNQKTGAWQRVMVEAYLQSNDRETLDQMRQHLKDIAQKARPRLQARPAENLGEARDGPDEAKNCIRLAAEESLGHQWAGDVYIRSLAVF
jgi:hypothetical protein